MKSNANMSKTERLFHLLQILRRYRYPLSGQFLANELGVSTRTIYRDIAALQAQGADIEGEPGLGYVLKPGFMLPPLMFNEEEIEALVLGTRWVVKKRILTCKRLRIMLWLKLLLCFLPICASNWSYPVY